MKYLMAVLVATSFAYTAQSQTVSFTLNDKKLKEVSGIACSKKNKHIIWMHNDSGDKSYVYAVNDSSGKIAATLDYAAAVTDCEDMTMDYKEHKIFMGDIGDNNARRKFIVVYKMSEPTLHATDTAKIITEKAEVLYLKYPDGPRDAETLMADSENKLLYIVSKREDTVAVYTAPLDFKNGDTITLEKRCKLYFSGWGVTKWITAGDISPDGTGILLKSYSQVYYWRRNTGEPVWQTMERKPQILPYKVEKQGEAICFGNEMNTYYTTSEGKEAPVYFYHFSR